MIEKQKFNLFIISINSFKSIAKLLQTWLIIYFDIIILFNQLLFQSNPIEIVFKSRLIKQ